MSWLSDLFNKKETLPISISPIEINVSNSSQFKRNVGRLVSLLEALEQGDLREDIKTEIEARVEACIQFGHEAPKSLQEAKQLFDKVNV